MQIAQVLAGYSLGEADLLRRAMGKKIREEMEKQRERFVSGAMERGIESAQADLIFELLAKFADYGFNKSHAAAYALVAYQTAYMKAHYPTEFLAASMTLDMGNTDKLSEFRAEAERLGLKVEAPSVNRSGVTFDAGEGVIHYALAALKGVGVQAVESIVEARASQPFASVPDFAARINPKAINKRVLESMIAAGAFDALDPNRARLHHGADTILGHAQRAHQDAQSGQNELFGAIKGASDVVLPQAEPWLPAEQLQKEYDAIGFFLSGHPLDEYAVALKRLRVQPWADFVRAVKGGASAGKVAASVVSRMERRTKTGNKMGIFGFSDPTGQFEAVIFSEGLAEFRERLEPGNVVLLQLSAELQGEEVRARIIGVESLDAAAAKTQKGLRIYLRDDKPLDSIARRLGAGEPVKSAGGQARQSPPSSARNPSHRNGPGAIEQTKDNGARASERGEGEVALILMLGQDTEVEMKLPGRYPVSPQVAGALKAVPGVVMVELV